MHFLHSLTTIWQLSNSAIPTDQQVGVVQGDKSGSHVPGDICSTRKSNIPWVEAVVILQEKVNNDKAYKSNITKMFI